MTLFRNPVWPAGSRWMWVLVWALVMLLACLAPRPAGAAGVDAATLRGIVDATIRPLMAQHDIPGMAVGVTVDGQAQVFNYGLAARQARQPVTDATLFEIGSVTKVFTATLASYAEASGRLSLSDHPGRYLPRLAGRPIDRSTLLHLGTYTAGGLPLQFPDEVASDDASAIGYLAGWQPTARPGTVRAYSNPSIGLLGEVAGVALKESFAAALERQLLPRLGLRHTHVRLPSEAAAAYAWGERDGQPVHAKLGPLGEATYGVKTTAGDLLRLVQLNLDPSGLEPAVRRAIAATQVGHFRVGQMVQGLGWEQYPWPLSRESLLGGNAAEVIFDPNPVMAVPAQAAATPRLFNKTGSTGGFGAYVVFIAQPAPQPRIGLVMLANKNYPIPARVEAAWAILNQLAPQD